MKVIKTSQGSGLFKIYTKNIYFNMLKIDPASIGIPNSSFDPIS